VPAGTGTTTRAAGCTGWDMGHLYSAELGLNGHRVASGRGVEPATFPPDVALT
jgi:hypothetical protein